MDIGFIKADSRNLPKVDMDMVRFFFMENKNYTGVEMKGQKLARSTRESYGDNAVGFVQVKRLNQLCIVKGRITPEHKLREKGYCVEAQIDEKDEVVQVCKCHDCAAAEGGCKHAIAFLLWLHRRSEEPSSTSVTCYWKKSKMSLSSSSNKFIRARDFGIIRDHVNNSDILSDFLVKVSKTNCQASVIRYYEDRHQPLSIHKLCTNITVKNTPQNFLHLMAVEMTEDRIQAAFNSTKQQSESSEWFELRYGRITGSILHEAAHCHTPDGSLVNKIMGEHSTFTSQAMLRGKKLEKDVIRVVSEKEKIRVKGSGLILSQEFPVLGATPDGLTDDYVLEIKSPSTDKAFQTYVKDGVLNKKFWTQIQAQMYFSKKRMGLFCVAHPDFESSKNVDVYKVPYDENIKVLLDRATIFWSNVIFEKLKTIYNN